MDIKDVQRILQENNIRESCCLIDPQPLVDGALCLCREKGTGWRVLLNERGTFLINEFRASEDAACRLFLSYALSDPTHKKDFRQADLLNYHERAKALLIKYGLPSLRK
jgi:hypothetical protein